MEKMNGIFEVFRFALDGSGEMNIMFLILALSRVVRSHTLSHFKVSFQFINGIEFMQKHTRQMVPENQSVFAGRVSKPKISKFDTEKYNK